MERKHQHLINTTLTLLTHAGLPTHFWLEALNTAVYLANRLPHSTLQFQVPYVLLFQKSPDYLSLKPFGCACFPWLKPYVPHKLTPKSLCCVFLGYCATTKGYRCYDPIGDKVYLSRHVRFDEHTFPYHSLVSSIPSHVQHNLIPPSFQFLSLSLMISQFLSLILLLFSLPKFLLLLSFLLLQSCLLLLLPFHRCLLLLSLLPQQMVIHLLMFILQFFPWLILFLAHRHFLLPHFPLFIPCKQGLNQGYISLNILLLYLLLSLSSSHRT